MHDFGVQVPKIQKTTSSEKLFCISFVCVFLFFIGSRGAKSSVNRIGGFTALGSLVGSSVGEFVGLF